MNEEANKRDFNVYQCETSDLFINDGVVYASSRNILSAGSTQIEGIIKEDIKVCDFHMSFMRKDPPVDENYINALHLLGLAEKQGASIYNKPNSIKEFNEKIFALHFKKFIPKTLVTAKIDKINEFFKLHEKIVVKPLDGMGGKSIFVVDESDGNANVIIETLTNYGTCSAMAQVFIPEIKDGDKRILLIDGKPVPYALARIPSKDDNRGNLVMGAVGEGRDLTERDKLICSKISETLKKKGILFCGIDVIGDYLTEINSTSPTGIRELDSIYNLNIASDLFDVLEKKIN